MFRILESIELQGWREQPIDMPLTKWLRCPCDGTELQTVAAITGELPQDRYELGKPYVPLVGEFKKYGTIRVGACPTCGYIGYQDRPSAQWFQEFYAQDWDQNKDIDGMIANIRENGMTAPAHSMIETVKSIPFDADAKVFEMGTGYGWALRCMHWLGYRKLTGIESCPHRARVAREAFGLDVRHESLEQHEGGPYDLILSFHVLEHCYDPGAIIAKLASLQAVGGHLVLAVPNAAGEPTMGVLGFLPHLHSFTDDGLKLLLWKYGYEVHMDSGNHRGHVIVAVKQPSAIAFRPRPIPPLLSVIEKLSMGTRWYPDCQRLWWPMHEDKPGGCTAEGWADIGREHKPRCLHVEPIQQRLTNAPLEIQWAGPLRLWVK